MDLNISVVTFESGNENENHRLQDLSSYLKEAGFNTELLIFSERQKENKENIKYISSVKKTKFERIKDSLQIAKFEYILFVDNDIFPNNRQIESFLRTCPAETDIAWGVIGVQNESNVISKLIEIDKNISHKIIRPILWKLDIGITIPGQVFLIRKQSFFKITNWKDTVFDDLTIGLYTKKNKLRFWFDRKCLGREEPSSSLSELLSQRKRWGVGFRETWDLSKKEGMSRYCFVHAVFYHFLWVPIFFTAIFLSLYVCPLSFLYLLIICNLYICRFRFSLFVYGLIYLFIFPAIHIVWFDAFLRGK